MRLSNEESLAQHKSGEEKFPDIDRSGQGGAQPLVSPASGERGGFASNKNLNSVSLTLANITQLEKADEAEEKPRG